MHSSVCLAGLSIFNQTSDNFTISCAQSVALKLPVLIMGLGIEISHVLLKNLYRSVPIELIAKKYYL